MLKSSRFILMRPAAGWFVRRDAPLSVQETRTALDAVACDEILVLNVSESSTYMVSSPAPPSLNVRANRKSSGDKAIDRIS